MARKKFELEVLFLEDISSDGRAVGKHDGKAVFVKDLVPGDKARVRVFRKRKSYLEAESLEILEPSSDRIEASCAHFDQCGGCKWQNLSYERLLALKDQHVKSGFKKIAHWEPEEYEEILPAPKTYAYRNKLEYTFSNKRWLSYEEIQSGTEFEHRNALGFHVAGMFDKVIDIENCLLQGDQENNIRNGIRRFCLEEKLSFYDIRENHGLMRNLIIRNNQLGELMVIVVFGEDDRENIQKVMEHLRDNFDIRSLNYVVNLKKNDSISDQKVVTFSGTGFLMEYLLDLNFRIHPKSFFQTNFTQTASLYQIGLEYAQLSKDDVLYDLYCGTGTIGLSAASKVKKVVGVEYVEAAVEDAWENAEINGIANAYFEAGDLKDVLTDEFAEKHGRPSLIMIDPPRAGMHADVVEQVRKLNADRIVYISCNPATQARDLDLLKEAYHFRKSRAVDMFPQTSHIENVVLLERK
jgi:23S rRNA (uracil1939-C5)-methyltransferase